MRICIVIAEGYDNPLVDPDALSDIGSTWGSWRTWRAWKTDNVLCNDKTKASDLITRAFQAVCNLYIPKKYYVELNRPVGIKLYEGEFPAEFDKIEDIVSMHLVAEQNDLVLLLGFDLVLPKTEDKYQDHKNKNYVSAFTSAVRLYENTQWVLIDVEHLPETLEDLPNITCDSYQNVLDLLS